MDVGSYNTIILGISESLLLKWDSDLVHATRPSESQLPGFNVAQSQRSGIVHSWLSRELSAVRNCIAVVNHWHRFADGDSDLYWFRQFNELVTKLHWLNVKMECNALHSLEAQARQNPYAAYHRLVGLILRVLTESVQRIKCRLAKAAHLSALLYFGHHQSNVMAGFINSNRAWFLHHGAHPNGSCSAVEGCSTGGLTPAFA